MSLARGSRRALSVRKLGVLKALFVQQRASEPLAKLLTEDRAFHLWVLSKPLPKTVKTASLALGEIPSV
jgi:hypothetical protein